MDKTVVTVVTASTLTTTQRKVVEEIITKKLGQATIKEVIDQSVVGGIKIRLGTQEFDATVLGKLEKLEPQLPEVLVTTAVPLSAEQKQTLKKAVENKYGSVQFIEQVDQSVVGGIKVVVDSTEYDGTVHGKLHKLEQTLLKTL